MFFITVYLGFQEKQRQYIFLTKVLQPPVLKRVPMGGERLVSPSLGQIFFKTAGCVWPQGSLCS